MHRRDFLLATAVAGLAPKLLAAEPTKTAKQNDPSCCGPGYPSPREAAKAPPEKLLYTIGLYVGTDTKKPDYLATVDVDPSIADLFAGDPSAADAARRRRAAPLRLERV